MPSRTRIDPLARQLGLTIDDDRQWDFLLATDSVDVQAAPGSGKTSLVVLKLLALAGSWAEPSRGICVLSHTNTAKHEITDGLTRLPAGARLLEYPHFIGTIQEFTHTFLALPAIRSKGITVESIDDERCRAVMERALDRSPYWTLRSALEMSPNRRPKAVEATYRFDQKTSSLQIHEPPYRETSRSGAQLIKLKEEVSSRGIYRYDDMYAIAAEYLHLHPWAGAALRFRFPYVLIDEMQDTSIMQDELLLQVFSAEGNVIQRVGDVNQRIFDAKNRLSVGSSFPRQGKTINLATSRRFGHAIAEVASRFTVNEPQQTLGSSGAPTGTLAIITFDEASILNVTPRFEKLAAQIVPLDVLREHPPRVLGWRGNPGDGTATPRAITCYAPHYTPPPTPRGPGRLLAHVRTAHNRAITHPERLLGESAQELWEAIRHYSRTLHPNRSQEALTTGLPPLRNLDRTPRTAGHRTRLAILDMLTNPPSSAQEWSDQVATLLAALSTLTGLDHTTNSLHEEWLSFHDSIALQETVATPRLVPAVLSTTHSAKGETHSATLILECVNMHGQKHDLRALLPYLTGQRTEYTQQSTREAARLAFVAATRPRHLLALAVHQDPAQPYLARLAELGWKMHSANEQIPIPTPRSAAVAEPLFGTGDLFGSIL
ncbi:UvrD-helicase domain-containing protein [Actinocorallia sp. API 0066]|uniref:UvrD-helicase domain-containing protein n=1 Tax=Actinocorallia sp. API 0066 TaxID=2896846 RepID=UPI001E6203CB|nr:UvrD-helicase domain-containing protein [Actinocorallia sp. API 0066]MCD0449472.1 UvrD-helicase domain-containing protein [Actinocorallia sp. API 0066]